MAGQMQGASFAKPNFYVPPPPPVPAAAAAPDPMDEARSARQAILAGLMGCQQPPAMS